VGWVFTFASHPRIFQDKNRQPTPELRNNDVRKPPFLTKRHSESLVQRSKGLRRLRCLKSVIHLNTAGVVKRETKDCSLKHFLEPIQCSIDDNLRHHKFEYIPALRASLIEKLYLNYVVEWLTQQAMKSSTGSLPSVSCCTVVIVMEFVSFIYIPSIYVSLYSSLDCPRYCIPQYFFSGMLFQQLSSRPAILDSNTNLVLVLIRRHNHLSSTFRMFQCIDMTQIAIRQVVIKVCESIQESFRRQAR
jgi:hypothetical protein